MINLLGTVHVFDVRRKVRDFVVKKNPDVVCVELDEERRNWLMKYGVPSSPEGIAQEFIARFRGAHVGDDMRGAIDGAKEIGLSR
jgi:pheromone shutdown protein TraB